METTPQLWARVKAIASAALDLDAAARAAFVDEACQGDAGLRAEVVSLLDSTDAAQPFFEKPPAFPGPGLVLPDSRIGPYRVIRELASGGMGSVFLAERADGEFQQRVAIKIVRGGFGDAFLLERFREERRILATLDHPNIARLLDGGTTAAGLPYVVMEFIEGQAIDQYCAARNLPLRDRLLVFQQVCAAVQYAHQHLVIHRDIKASNILVTETGVPKLLDFGIAKLVDVSAGAAAAYTAVRIMTPESASPEQLSGQPVTVAADIYALGVLLYSLLTQASPYRGAISSHTDLVRAVCEETPEPPSTRTTSLAIPADVDMILLKALRKEPERRYASAAELSDDIRRFLEGLPVLASPDSLRYRAGKFVARHRVAVAATAALVVAIVAGVGATVWQARVAERERGRAERQFNAVRGLAQSVLGELHDAVQELPGSTKAREILLRRGTEYLDALANEAGADALLARDVADGYLRLATVQGAAGLANLGDRDGALATYRKAIAMLEPLAAEAGSRLDDRMKLANSLLRYAGIEPDQHAADHARDRARAIVESLSGEERSVPAALTTRQLFWSDAAAQRRRGEDWPGARDAFQQQLAAAEEALKLSPDSPNASRNLSLAYKSLGAASEMLGQPAEALKLYESALELDRRRVEKEPSQLLWQLDLSFAVGSIGALQMAASDLAGARRHYEDAVKLREGVVAADPDDDFARLALARGFERLALVHQGLGDAATAVDYGQKRVQVFRQRLANHPERDQVWAEFTQNTFAAAQAGRQAIAAAPSLPAGERHRLAEVTAQWLDEIASVQQKWRRERPGKPLAPEADAIAEERSRLAPWLQ
jgi:tetratricopeptide (TPR) repeat protein